MLSTHMLNGGRLCSSATNPPVNLLHLGDTGLEAKRPSLQSHCLSVESEYLYLVAV